MHIVLINPCRIAGFSYCNSIVKYTKHKIIAVWSNFFTYKNFRQIELASMFDTEICAFNLSFDQLISKLKQFEIKAIVGIDDDGFLVADKLQPIFTPAICNDPKLIEIRSNKLKYLEFLKNKQLVLTNQKVVDWNNFPIINKKYILKPVNGGGNENVYKIDPNTDTSSLINKHKDEKFLIQDYIEGDDEYCVELCTYGDYHKCTTVMKYGRVFYHNNNPWRYDNDLVDPDTDLVSKLIEYTKKVISALGIKIGATWTQIKVINNTFHLIEVNFRAQGHGHPEAVKNSTGFLYSGEVLKSMLGNHQYFMNSPNVYKMQGNFKKLCINNKREKFIDKIDVSEIKNLNSVKQIFLNNLVLPGKVPISNSFLNVIGVIIIQNNNVEEFNNDFEKVTKWQKQIEE